MIHYLRTFLQFDPPAIRQTAVLTLAAAVSEAAGLMLLVPLLAIAGVVGGQVTHPAWSLAMAGWLANIDPRSRLPFVLALFVVVMSAQSGLILVRDRQSHELHLRFVNYLRERLFASVAASPWNYLAQRHSGELLNSLTGDIQRIGVGTLYLIQTFTIAVMCAAYLVVALYLSPSVTFLALLTGGALWLTLRGPRIVERRSGTNLTQVNERMYIRIQEFLASLKLIKIHAEEKSSVSQFRAILKRALEQQLAFRKAQTSMQLTYRIGGTVALAVLTYVALEQVHVPTASLLVLIAIFARLLPQLYQVQGAMSHTSHMLPAYDNWRTQLAAFDAAQEAASSGECARDLNDSIVLRSVRYRHPGSHHTLRADNVCIPARKTTGIFGPSGSGKTSLLDIISGVNPPDEGDLLIDGEPLPLGCKSWRRTIAYIPQDTVIIDGTIRANVAWGNETADDAEIWDVLRQSAAAGFVSKLPDGLRSTVGERGARLSGGERQRLALARALLRRPQLLLLDEATSALDEENHRTILDAIRRLHGRITILVVTHQEERLDGVIDGQIAVDHGVVHAWKAISPS